MRACLAVVIVAAITSAQAPAPQPPVFRTTTRLVQVNVVVHDKRGQPIADLKKEDFTVFERGKPQPIALFSLNGESGSAAPPVLPAHIFSNAVALKAGVPTGVTVILLDLVNTGLRREGREGQSAGHGRT